MMESKSVINAVDLEGIPHTAHVSSRRTSRVPYGDEDGFWVLPEPPRSTVRLNRILSITKDPSLQDERVDCEGKIVLDAYIAPP